MTRAEAGGRAGGLPTGRSARYAATCESDEGSTPPAGMVGKLVWHVLAGLPSVAVLVEASP